MSASAKREDLIRHNPTVGAALPSRDEQHRIEHEEDDLDGHEEEVKVLTTEQLATLLKVAPPRHQLLFRLLAATGLRIGEALALRWGDLVIAVDELGGAVVFREPPAVKVRRSLRHGRFKSPKSQVRPPARREPRRCASVADAGARVSAKGVSATHGDSG